MAFKREYLKNHSHYEGLSFGEESSFTNGFTEPMIQLHPEKCIVVSCHNYNTVNKQHFISQQPQFTFKKNTNICKIIPYTIFQKMKLLLNKI